MAKKREATPYVQKAIQALVDYNWSDEEDDYEQCSNDPEVLAEHGANQKKGHIFESLKTVQRWLDR